jgi:hypothetical protein
MSDTVIDVLHERLRNHRLIGPKLARPADVVDWLGAVQAQEFPAATWAVAQRMKSPSEAGVERAFDAGEILRTHLLRPTWHFVTPSNIRWLLALTAPRVHALNDRIYRRIGFDEATRRRSYRLLEKALEGGRSLTRDELRNEFERGRISTEGDLRMSYLMMRAELDGLVCSGPRKGTRFTYALLDERAPAPGIRFERDQALQELARVYLRSRAPATPHDFAKWSSLTLTEARRGFAGLGRARKPRTPAVTGPVAHLLPVYDEYLGAYRDRSALAATTVGVHLAKLGNLLSSVVTINGRVVGTWRRPATASNRPQVTLLAKMNRAETRAIEAAIDQYERFLSV